MTRRGLAPGPAMAGWLLLALGAVGCQSGGPDPSPRAQVEDVADAGLAPVPLPHLSYADGTVRAQVQERHAELQELIDSGAPDGSLATAYGDFGTLLMAAECLACAEPAYRNAQALDGRDPRWPYYLGHLHLAHGRTNDALAAFERALELRPDDAATLIRLGRLHLDMGRPESAMPLFEAVLPRSPRSAAALAGLGQAALTVGDHAGAVRHLQEALALEPGAGSLRAPLAMAYRALGELNQAEAHLERWSDAEVTVPDPLMDALHGSLQSGLSYELRGVEALEAQDWARAEEAFRKGLDVTDLDSPLGRALRFKLGTARFLQGDVLGALEHFEATVQRAPDSGFDRATAHAHFSVALILASSGFTGEAIDRFSAALRYDPSHVRARLALADTLRGSGRVEASLPHYHETVRLSPLLADAWFGHAMGLVRLGRHREARDWLTKARAQHPRRLELTHALARLLAAAPDPRVRDGERARALVQDLMAAGMPMTMEFTATMAMVLAELGDYEGAAAVQRDIVTSLEQARADDRVPHLAETLRRYERGEPNRTPWPDDDPVHTPALPDRDQIVDADDEVSPS